MRAWWICLLAGALAGCTSAVESGHNTALDGADLLAMTDQMAASLAASPAMQEKIHTDGPLRIVVLPVENRMTAEVLPAGPADAFTARVRSLLSKRSEGSFTWIMNRDAWYALRGRELELGGLGPDPAAISPRYALHAIFSTLSSENSTRREAYYLCTYQLTDLQNRTVLWSDKYEVKKSAVKGFLD